MNEVQVSVSDLKRRLMERGFLYLISEDVADLTTDIYWFPRHHESARVWEWQDHGRVTFRPLTADGAIALVVSILRMDGHTAARALSLAQEKVQAITEPY